MKKTIMIVVMMIAIAGFAAADHIPVFEDRLFDYRGRLALLVDYGDFDPLVELEGAYDESEFLSSSPDLEDPTGGDLLLDTRSGAGFGRLGELRAVPGSQLQ